MIGYRYQRPPITLLNRKLTLNPGIAAAIAEIEAQLAARDWLERLQNPDWHQQTPLIQSWINAAPRPPPRPAIPAPPKPAVGPLRAPGIPFPGPIPSRPQISVLDPFDPTVTPKAPDVMDFRRPSQRRASLSR